jgi:general stress protein CsbA
VSGEEPVTAPDQHKPTVSPRLARLGVVLVAVLLAAMSIGNHEGNTENIWLISIAVLLLLSLVVDFILRRNGLKNQ